MKPEFQIGGLTSATLGSLDRTSAFNNEVTDLGAAVLDSLELGLPRFGPA